MEPEFIQAAETGARIWPALLVSLAGLAVGGTIGFLSGRSVGATSRAPWMRAARGDALWSDPSVWSEAAEQAFRRARRRARRDELAGRIRKDDAYLQSFDELIDCRRAISPRDRGIHTVPLSRIVGSVGKPELFTRRFNPRSDELRGRWKRAYGVAHGLAGYHPIELYQIGETFFIVDGHFRVSVAAALGADSIRAYVQEWD